MQGLSLPSGKHTGEGIPKNLAAPYAGPYFSNALTCMLYLSKNKLDQSVSWSTLTGYLVCLFE
jgi:hypothetical protein